jgi:hypothetical protein
MTSVLEAMTAIRNAERRAAEPVELPDASDAGIQLALELRETQSAGGGRIVLFVPTLRNTDASPAACDAVCGLVDLHDGPVLIIDLRARPNRDSTPSWLETLAAHEQVGTLWGAQTPSDCAVLWRPLAGRTEKAFCAAPDQLAARLHDARARYPYVVCIGDAVPSSMATLMIAGLADGVVLSVPAGRVTKPQVNDVTIQLRRARATLLGFVVDPRGVSREDQP